MNDPFSDKNRFPCACPEAQEKRIDTTFWDDFTIAEVYGIEAVKDTWERAFGEWKDDCQYLVELAMVMDRKGWYWYPYGEELAKYYFDRYCECCAYVSHEEGEPRFTKEERSQFYTVLD